MKILEKIDDYLKEMMVTIKKEGKTYFPYTKGKKLEKEGFDNEYACKKWIGKTYPKATIKGERRGM